MWTVPNRTVLPSPRGAELRMRETGRARIKERRGQGRAQDGTARSRNLSGVVAGWVRGGKVGLGVAGRTQEVGRGVEFHITHRRNYRERRFLFCFAGPGAREQVQMFGEKYTGRYKESK